MSKFSKTTKQQHVCVYPGECVKFLGITSVSQDPPLKRELSTRQCEWLLIGMTPSHYWVAPEIFPGLYSYLGALSRVSGFATLPIWSIPPVTVRLSIDYIEVTLVALPRISRGYFAGVILQVSRPGWGWIAQSLYVLKLRATIIGYVPPLVVYGSLKPLLGERYPLHSGAHISYPCFLVIWIYIL